MSENDYLKSKEELAAEKQKKEDGKMHGKDQDKIISLNKNQILMKAAQRFFKSQKGEEDKPVKECISMFNHFRIRPSSPSRNINQDMLKKKENIVSSNLIDSPKNTQQKHNQSYSPSKQLQFYKGAKDKAYQELRQKQETEEPSEDFLKDIAQFSPALVLKIDDPIIFEAITNLGMSPESMKTWTKLSDFYSIQESTRMQIRRYLTAINEVIYKIEAVIKERDRLINHRLKQKQTKLRAKSKENTIMIMNTTGQDKDSINNINNSSLNKTNISYKSGKNKQNNLSSLSEEVDNTGISTKQGDDQGYTRVDSQKVLKRQKDTQKKAEQTKKILLTKLMTKVKIEDRLTELRVREVIDYEEGQTKLEKIEQENKRKLKQVQKKQKEQLLARMQEKRQNDEEKREELMRFRRAEESKREKIMQQLVEDTIEYQNQMEAKEKEKNIDGCVRLKRNLAEHQLKEDLRLKTEEQEGFVTHEHFHRLQHSIDAKNTKYFDNIKQKALKAHGKEYAVLDKSIQEQEFVQNAMEDTYKKYTRSVKVINSLKRDEAERSLEKKYLREEKQQENKLRLQERERLLQEEINCQLKQMKDKSFIVQQNKKYLLSKITLNTAEMNAARQEKALEQAEQQKQIMFDKGTSILDYHNAEKKLLYYQEELYQYYLKQSAAISFNTAKDRLNMVSSPKLVNQTQILQMHSSPVKINLDKKIFKLNDHSF